MAWMVTQDQLDPEQRDFVNRRIKQSRNFWIKGWAVMLNYWGDPESTEKSI